MFALKEGLVLAKAKGITHLQVKTDAKHLLEVLQQPNLHPNHQLINLITDIVDLLKGAWTMELAHINRSANKVAHVLAKYAHNLADDFTLHCSVPSFAIPVFETDLAHARTPTSPPSSLP